MDVASSGIKTASERDYTVSTAIILSPAVFAGGKTQQRCTRQERRLSPISLHQSCTVTPQRSGYFHEAFNVASPDTRIIYHPEASQRGAAADNMLLFVSWMVYSEACWRDSLTWTCSPGICISSAHAAAPLGTKWRFFSVYFGDSCLAHNKSSPQTERPPPHAPLTEPLNRMKGGRTDPRRGERKDKCRPESEGAFKTLCCCLVPNQTCFLCTGRR